MANTIDTGMLAQLHNNYLANQKKASQPKKTTGRGGFLTSLIGEGGAAGGATAGAAAGSAILPGVGTLLGGLAGGIAGGIGGQLAENKVRDNQFNAGSAAKTGAFNGVLAAGPGELLKGASALTKGGVGLVKDAAPNLTSAIVDATDKAGAAPLKNSIKGKLTAAGNEKLAAQYGTISKPIARATKPIDTISQLADVGITKPIDAERVANGFTGTNGLVNKAVVSSVKGAAKVPIDSIPALVEKSATDNGLVDNDVKGIGNIVKAQIGRLGPEGTTNADPSDVLKVMKTLESKSADFLGKGGTYHLPTTEDKARAAVLGDVRNELENNLFKTADANGNVTKVLTPDFQQKLTALHPNNGQWKNFVDNKVMKATTVKQLRSIQKPFVNISKIINEGNDNAITYGGRVGNSARDYNSVKGALLGAVAKTAEGPTNRLAGKALRAAGGATSDIGAAALTGPTAKGALGRVGLTSGADVAGKTFDALRTGGTAFANGAAGGATSGASGSPQNLSDALTAAQNSTQSQPASQSPYSIDALQSDIQRDPANSSKYIDYYNSLDKIYNAQTTAAQPGFSKPTATEYAQASSALQSVGQLTDLLSKTPGVVNSNATPGQNIPGIGNIESSALGTTNYRALSNNILNAIARINTGANMPESEARFYSQTYMPQPGDSQQAIATKVQNLYSFFAPIANYQATAGTSANDLASAIQSAQGQ